MWILVFPVHAVSLSWGWGMSFVTKSEQSFCGAGDVFFKDLPVEGVYSPLFF